MKHKIFFQKPGKRLHKCLPHAILIGNNYTRRIVMKKIPPQTEKKMVYGIRSLKNGTGSVLIGASIVLLSAAMPTISANENLPQAQENTSAMAKAPTETEASQTQD